VPHPARYLPCLLALPAAAFGQATQSQPQPLPLPLPPAIQTPQDRPYPGQIGLAVDATDLDHHIMHVAETVPVAKAGDMVLLFPKWIPGNHSPTGPLPSLGGLIIKASGQRLEWVRDVVDVYAFHVNVPQGATSLSVDFDYLSPLEDQKEGRVVMTPAMLDVQWNPEVLYPAGYFARDITLHPSLTLPQGWKYGTALETESTSGARVTFKPTTLNVLLDSPLYAGKYFERIDLDPHGPAPVHLDVVADRPGDLVIKPEDLQAHRNLVQQAYKNYGSHHYDHYDFLLSLSDEMGGEGLEHHRSSENGTGREYFTDLEKSAAERDLLPHEYTHSWDGKFRRPADLWSPDFTVVPERDSLLWVYEGQTEYWGQILAARSGILKTDQVRDLIALDAASMDAEVGRSWRALQDTTNDPIIDQRRPLGWRSFSRAEDYYVEGLLIWLDADTLIREKTGNAKSLSDFARGFFGIDNGSYITAPYKFEDVVAALDAVMPYDWTKFLRTRLDGHPAGAPLDGLTRGGYKLVYTAEPSAMQKSMEGRRKSADFTFSLGLGVGHDGTLSSVQWGGPAFKAGLAAGGKLIAVNDTAFDDPDDLAGAIKQAAGGKQPIGLLLRYGNHFQSVKIDYHGGLRYPHLERIPNTPDRLDDILAAVK
jgi:predicted metalloprotease with PDZ domain